MSLFFRRATESAPSPMAWSRPEGVAGYRARRGSGLCCGSVDREVCCITAPLQQYRKVRAVVNPMPFVEGVSAVGSLLVMGSAAVGVDVDARERIWPLKVWTGFSAWRHHSRPREWLHPTKVRKLLMVVWT